MKAFGTRVASFGQESSYINTLSGIWPREEDMSNEITIHEL